MGPQLPLTVEPATLGHAQRLAPNLRQADVAEIQAASGNDPLRALAGGIEHSRESWCVTIGDEPIFMFGVVPMTRGFGAVWALGSDQILSVKREFLRWSPWWLAWISRDFDYVGNLIDNRNTAHVRWLKWLGFTFCEERVLNGHLFSRFSKCVNPRLCSPSARP